MVRFALRRRVALWVGEGGHPCNWVVAQATTRDTFERSRVGLVELAKRIRRAYIRSPGDPKIQKKIEEADESTSQGHFQPTASLTSRAARDIFVRQSPTESDESDESGHPPPPTYV